MALLERHLNLTFLLFWVLGNLCVYYGSKVAPADGGLAVEWLMLYILGAILILGSEIWYLHQKERSYFNLFWNLAWIAGLFIVLSLENNRQKKLLKRDAIIQEVERESHSKEEV